MKIFGYSEDAFLNNRTKMASFIGCLFLLVIADSFFLWNNYEMLIRAIVAFLVIGMSVRLYLNRRMQFTKDNIFYFLIVIVFFFYLIVSRTQNLNGVLFRMMQYLPMLLILLWSKEYLCGMYRCFYYVIVFFAIGSATISILSGLGLLNYIPYYELDARSALHERHLYVYRIYGCFVTIFDSNSYVMQRACGMLQEPGHFAITLGLVYTIERLLRHRLNIAIFVCGLLTFSSTFILMVLMVELVNIYRTKKYTRVLRNVLISIFTFFMVYSFLPQNLKNDINYLFYERNLSSVIDSFSHSSSLEEALDERINSSGQFYYDNFIKSNKVWFGENVHDDSIILSDYRGLILNMGIVGLIITLFMILSSTRHISFSARIPLIGVLILVLLHRSWMLYGPYLYILSFLGSTIFKMYTKRITVMEK